MPSPAAGSLAREPAGNPLITHPRTGNEGTAAAPRAMAAEWCAQTAIPLCPCLSAARSLRLPRRRPGVAPHCRPALTCASPWTLCAPPKNLFCTGSPCLFPTDCRRCLPRNTHRLLSVGLAPGGPPREPASGLDHTHPSPPAN